MLRELRNRRGSGVIEFLGLMPLVILIALAVWQFALVGYGIINTQAAARDGVRVAATNSDPADILRTVRTSFGEDTKFYRLDDVDINNDGSEAKVTVSVSFFTVFLPKSVTIPFTWEVTAPVYSDKAQVNVSSSKICLPEASHPNVSLLGVTLLNSSSNGGQSVRGNGQEAKGWSGA